MPQPLTDADRPFIKEMTEQCWHAAHVCIRGQLYYPHESEGFVFRREGRMVGLATFQQLGDSLLMVTQNSLEAGAGVGTSLVLCIIEEARKRGLSRVWLTTTNDNLRSLGFYQRMGFRLVAVHRDAVTQARKTIKPEVPETGYHGLPIHDEIELELILKPYLHDAS